MAAKPSQFITVADAKVLGVNLQRLSSEEVEEISLQIFFQRPWCEGLAIGESLYYSLMMKTYRHHHWFYPYNLSAQVLDTTKITAIEYYRSVVSSAIARDINFDAIPLFTAADIERTLGIERTGFTALVARAKESRKPRMLARLRGLGGGGAGDVVPRRPAPSFKRSLLPFQRLSITAAGRRLHASLVEAVDVKKADQLLLDALARIVRAPGVEAGRFTPSLCAFLLAEGLVSEQLRLPGATVVCPKRVLQRQSAFLLHSAPAMAAFEELLYKLLVAIPGPMLLSDVLRDVPRGDSEQRLAPVVVEAAVRLGYVEVFPPDLAVEAAGWPRELLQDATRARAAVEQSPSTDGDESVSITLLFPTPLPGALMVSAAELQSPKIQLLGQKMLETGRLTPVEAAELVGLLPEAPASEQGACAALRNVLLGVAALGAGAGRFPHLLQISSALKVPQSQRAVLGRGASVFVALSLPGTHFGAFPRVPGAAVIGPAAPDAASFARLLWLYAALGAGPTALFLPRGAVLHALPAALRGARTLTAISAKTGARTVSASPCALRPLRAPLVLCDAGPAAARTSHVALPLEDGADVPFASELAACGLGRCVGVVTFLEAPGGPVPLSFDLGLPLEPHAAARAAAAHLFGPGASAERLGCLAEQCAVVSREIVAFAARHGFRPSRASPDNAAQPQCPLLFHEGRVLPLRVCR